MLSCVNVCAWQALWPQARPLRAQMGLVWGWAGICDRSLSRIDKRCNVFGSLTTCSGIIVMMQKMMRLNVAQKIQLSMLSWLYYSRRLRDCANYVLLVLINITECIMWSASTNTWLWTCWVPKQKCLYWEHFMRNCSNSRNNFKGYHFYLIGT